MYVIYISIAIQNPGGLPNNTLAAPSYSYNYISLVLQAVLKYKTNDRCSTFTLCYVLYNPLVYVYTAMSYSMALADGSCVIPAAEKCIFRYAITFIAYILYLL